MKISRSHLLMNLLNHVTCVRKKLNCAKSLVLASSLTCFTSLNADAAVTHESMLGNEAMSLADRQKQTPPNVGVSQKSCKTANHPHRVDIKHIEAKGIGYNQGYTSLDAFFTSIFGDYIPFCDVRAHVFNNGKWATNLGVGARYIFDPCRWMVGGNLYYDYRSTNHAHYNQISVGMEAFYDRYEAHLNGYLPVGQKRTATKRQIESVSFKSFSGNYILQNEHYKNTYEGAMKGFNAELGMHLAGNRMQYDLYFGVGPYYYDVSSGKHAWGGKARLKAELTRYLFLEISDSYDRIFHNRFQGTVNVSIPFGGKICYPQKSARSCHNVMDWQAVLPVERQEIIVVSKFKKDKTIDPVAIDPTTGQPFFVVFVKNTNSSLGTGTFEDPFQNLTNNDNPVSAENFATDGNIIYVFAGDGSSTHMSGGNMSLNDNQRLLGSAHSHLFQTTKGLLTIPGLTSLVPHVQGPSVANASIINLANNCEVSGFNISFPTFTATTDDFACINGSPSVGPIVNANINNNVLTNQTYGVILGSAASSPGANIATGTIILENNISSGQGDSSTAARGASYFIQAQDANITVANNIAQNNVNGAVGVLINGFGNVIADLTDNIVRSSPRGMQCFDRSTTGVDNRFVIQRNIVDNTINDSFTFQGVPSVPSSLTTFVVVDNAFTNAQTQGVIVSENGSILCVRFNNNKGYPTHFSGIPYRMGKGGGVAGTFNLEPPTNNYPAPTVGNISNLVPACSCGSPCN